MNVRLNLLPWREGQRLATVRRFRLTLVASLLVAFAAVMTIDRLAQLRLQQQAVAYAAREAQVRSLDAALRNLDETGTRFEAMRAQHAKLSSLRTGQGGVTQLLVDIEQAMPSGMRLTALQLQGEQVSLNGLVVSSAVLAQFMRELQRSTLIQDLKLRHVQSLPAGDDFLLTARMNGLGS